MQSGLSYSRLCRFRPSFLTSKKNTDQAQASCSFWPSTAMRFTISPTVVVFLAAPANLNACKYINYFHEKQNYLIVN